MNLTHINMFPTPDMKKNLAWMHSRDPHTNKLKLHIDGHLARAPPRRLNPSRKRRNLPTRRRRLLRPTHPIRANNLHAPKRRPPRPDKHPHPKE